MTELLDKQRIDELEKRVADLENIVKDLGRRAWRLELEGLL